MSEKVKLDITAYHEGGHCRFRCRDCGKPIDHTEAMREREEEVRRLSKLLSGESKMVIKVVQECERLRAALEDVNLRLGTLMLSGDAETRRDEIREDIRKALEGKE